MEICALCKKVIVVDKHMSRKATCPNCGADLHICLNCKFYSEKAHNKCLEPKADFQRTRDRANFCDYFIFRESRTTVLSNQDKEEAFKKLEDLFKKRPT